MMHLTRADQVPMHPRLGQANIEAVVSVPSDRYAMIGAAHKFCLCNSVTVTGVLLCCTEVGSSPTLKLWCLCQVTGALNKASLLTCAHSAAVLAAFSRDSCTAVCRCVHAVCQAASAFMRTPQGLRFPCLCFYARCANKLC